MSVCALCSTDADDGTAGEIYWRENDHDHVMHHQVAVQVKTIEIETIVSIQAKNKKKPTETIKFTSLFKRHSQSVRGRRRAWGEKKGRQIKSPIYTILFIYLTNFQWWCTYIYLVQFLSLSLSHSHTQTQTQTTDRYIV